MNVKVDDLWFGTEGCMVRLARKHVDAVLTLFIYTLMYKHITPVG